MEHPQPAFDLFQSFPLENSLDESLLLDWFAYNSIDAEKGDNISEHPEVWKHWELPDALANLSTDDYVAYQKFSGELNLNAFAIGLGLGDVKYEPEKFSRLVYCPETFSATVFAFWQELIFSIGDTEDAAKGGLTQMTNRMAELGLGEDVSFKPHVQTQRVADFI
ncbi:hypothetical protein SAMN05216388_104219 [Halorientalis persicus]|uniref:Uncharacterized protein n=1 Tax=Halorientalis persicus TaxID=1367881 RepID=A0A1H8VVD8_9EURY|nr:hypothetical protein [Halorientalis persicus]SEP19197.1 hypothetical protein SAMN05216388_104219 [Halorientalis persicus]